MDDDMTIAEAARIIGLSISQTRALAKSGELHARKIGRDWVVRQQDAERVASRPRPKRGPKPGNGHAS